MPDLTGQSIARYHIIGPLGEGGMATVYKAYDTRLERNVAFKVIRLEEFAVKHYDKLRQRFEREARALAKLRHPNIVAIIDYGEHGEEP
jgi:serine/threonine protein kinase